MRFGPRFLVSMVNPGQTLIIKRSWESIRRNGQITCCVDWDRILIRSNWFKWLLIVYRLCTKKRSHFCLAQKKQYESQVKQHPLGLASGSHHSLLKIVTSHPDLAGKFQVVVSADDVQLGKPSPDIYIETARKMGVSPENCLCLEDSGNGIRAGKAAGMKVIAIPDSRFAPPKGVLQMADLVLKSLGEFTPALLDRLSRS